MSTHKRAPAVLLLLAAAIALMLIAAGCNNGDDPDDDPTRPESSDSTPTEPTTSTPATPQEEAEAEAKKLVNDWNAHQSDLMADPKKADLSTLDEFLVKPELTAQRSYLTRFRAQGFYTNGGTPKTLSARVTDSKLTPAKKQATVSLTVCYDLDGVIAYNKDGEEAAPNRINPSQVTYEIWNYSYPNPSGWRIGIETVQGKECKR